MTRLRPDERKIRGAHLAAEHNVTTKQARIRDAIARAYTEAKKKHRLICRFSKFYHSNGTRQASQLLFQGELLPQRWPAWQQQQHLELRLHFSNATTALVVQLAAGICEVMAAPPRQISQGCVRCIWSRRFSRLASKEARAVASNLDNLIQTCMPTVSSAVLTIFGTSLGSVLDSWASLFLVSVYFPSQWMIEHVNSRKAHYGGTGASRLRHGS